MARSRWKEWLITITDLRVVAGVILLVDVALICLFVILQAENCL